jgi:hypothetical protein
MHLRASWSVYALILLLPLCGAVLNAFIAWVIRLITQPSGSYAPDGSPSSGPTSPQERAMVLKMLSEGKLTTTEATALLDAAGDSLTNQPDRGMFSSGTLASIIGALLISIGFVLPWVSIHIENIRGYQTGYQVGALGWVILTLGVIPAILACIPALDRHLRQPLLRLLFAALGGGFALAIAINAAEHQGETGIHIVLVGFIIQLISALAVLARARRSVVTT